MYKDYFDLLQIEKDFSINLEILESNYLQLQTKYHPDQAEDSTQRVKFLNISANLNVAYKTLANDFSRAQYLLSLNGLSLEDLKSTDACSEFLQQILEEILEKSECLQNIDDQSQLLAFVKNQKSNREELINKMHKAFIDANMQNFLIYTYQMKYLDKIVENAQKKLFGNC